ncbi:recombinase family protein [Kribbella sp. NPDC051718]|uniref:recombinase family protein n=1 Tax=Kribbella sp. NPDC051718 TaxID=3155168 RepID=UPI00343C6512
MPKKPALARKPRAVLYLRLSESDDTSTSIARQETDLRARAEREGWEVVEVLIDDGLSGGYTREKALRALEMIRTSEADVLAAWKFDRWSRQGLTALAQLIDALDVNPHSLFIADQDGLSSSQPAWRIIASVLAEVARMERENTQVRVRSSIAALKKDGRYSGGNVPYGYKSVKDPEGVGRVLVPHPEEAEIIREVARRVLAGETRHKIMLDLNKREIPTRRGNRWSAQVLRQILVGEAIVGRVTHEGEVLRDADGLPLEVWPPVLDLETWHRIRAKLETDKAGRDRAQRRRRARRLSGIVTCGDCNRPLYVRYSKANAASYGCGAKANGKKCAGVSMKADVLEAWVTARFLEQFGPREVMRHVEELPDIAALAEVEAAISATAAKMTNDDADVSALASQLAALKERRAELKSRPAVRVVKLVPTGRTFAQTWEAASEEERNAILADNVVILSVRKGKRGGGPIDMGRVTLVTQPERLPEDAASGTDRVYAEAA